MTTIKICKDNDGYLWAIALPEDVDDCENGPVLGPPEGLRKDVHNRLVEVGLYNAFELQNNRAVLLKVLRELGVEKSYARIVTSIYQQQYYSKEDE